MNDWHEANKTYLMSELAIVRSLLESRNDASHDMLEKSRISRENLEKAASAMSAPPALDTLCAVFSLSRFERNVLLLCAGVELDSTFASMCAQGDPKRAFPTFSLALAILPEPHWSALTPVSPLRHFRLIEIGPGDTITQSPLRIDERVLHYLTGVQYLDERLAGMVEPLTWAATDVESHREIAGRVARTWQQNAGNSGLPALELCGEDASASRAIAAMTCGLLGMNVSVISASAVPTASGEIDAFIKLWEREAALGGIALLLDCDGTDTLEPAREKAVNRLIEGIRSALVITCRDRRPTGRRSMIIFDIPCLTPGEQREIWKRELGTLVPGLNGQVEGLVSQFNLGAQAISNACAQVRGCKDSKNPDETGNVLWEACLSQVRPQMENLAQRIKPAAEWDDLVLPEKQIQTLREIAAQVRHRATVYEKWGFSKKESRGMGISALFVGESGTGKTMAAEVLANELRLDLYRIDLSQVVTKYIGETEKNLRRVFDAADEGGGLLLFDEADALFGKRSEVRDSHDRYANIEVSYLLARMEAYRGLAILTTNMKNALDPAFLRRIRFIVRFPFPDTSQRAEIWNRIFPEKKFTEGLDTKKLAQLNVAGGNIHNIALNAAFLAADGGEPVRMSHILRAARNECAKLEKSLSEAEIGGWV
ncbi:Proteasome-activating nucleotidase [uncultured archaeon]|nr:Proteasome-activating nucleotidase [uncultured archaeon]